MPVRFDTDRSTINLAAFAAGDIPAIPLVEIRLDAGAPSTRTGLAAHLAAGSTTLCRCWQVTRQRRRPCSASPTTTARSPSTASTYEPESGFDASEDTSATGFAIGGLEALGALSSERLTAADLAAGLYDNAEVAVFLVNWTTPDERHLLRVGHLGEVTREDGAFRAEVRGLAAALDQPQRARLPPCLRRRPRRCALRHRSRRSRPIAARGTVVARERQAALHGERARRLRRRLVRARPARLDERRQCRPRHRGARAPRRRRRRDVRAVAGDALATSRPATRSPSPPAATSSSRPAGRSSPTRSTSAASRTCPATTSRSSYARAGDGNDGSPVVE